MTVKDFAAKYPIAPRLVDEFESQLRELASQGHDPGWAALGVISNSRNEKARRTAAAWLAKNGYGMIEIDETR